MFVYLLLDDRKTPLHAWTTSVPGGTLERDLANLGLLDRVTKIEVPHGHQIFLIVGGAEPFSLVPGHELAEMIEREGLGLYVPDYSAGGPNLDHRLTSEEIFQFLAERGKFERVAVKRSPGLGIIRLRLGAPFPAKTFY